MSETMEKLLDTVTGIVIAIPRATSRATCSEWLDKLQVCISNDSKYVE
jgi:hypothetical protein